MPNRRLLAAAAAASLVVSVVVPLVPGSTATAATSPLSSPAPPPAPNRQLNAVSALSASDVWAVGSQWVHDPSVDGSPLAMHWNGTTWSAVRVPGATLDLTDVSADSPTDAWAVGGGAQPGMVHWDGQAWRRVPLGNLLPAGTEFKSVSADAANDVWAVGYLSEQERNVVLHFDGAHWTSVPLPTFPHAAVLNAVTARSASDVWVVGLADTSVFLHWNGQSWTRVPGTNPSEPVDVFASSAGDAWVADESTDLPHWTGGSRWQKVPQPKPERWWNHITAVSGTSSSDVWFTGYRSEMPLIEHWDGATVVSVPAPAPSCNVARLTGVSAVNPTEAFAVGHYRTDTGVVQPFMLRWDGTAWAVMRSSTPADAPSAEPAYAGIPGFTSAENLTAIHAVAPDDVWAVGSRSGSSSFAASYHWNGSEWRRAPVPRAPGDVSSRLTDIEATVDGDLWAVGDATTVTGLTRAIAVHWTASGWVRVPLPQVGINQFFTSVSVRSSDDVWIVGHDDADNGSSEPMVLHWDGRVVTRVANPRLDRYHGPIRLQSVSARAADDVWITGTYSLYSCGSTAPLPFVWHWDGTALTATTLPEVHGSAFKIYPAVVPLAPDDAWLVGAMASRPLVVHWDGTAWTRSTTPIPPGAVSMLTSASATGPSDVWAVGPSRVFSPPSSRCGLILHFDGDSWRRVADPAPDACLESVSADAPGDAWAVGSEVGRSGELRPVILHWFAGRWHIGG